MPGQSQSWMLSWRNELRTTSSAARPHFCRKNSMDRVALKTGRATAQNWLVFTAGKSFITSSLIVQRLGETRLRMHYIISKGDHAIAQWYIREQRSDEAMVIKQFSPCGTWRTGGSRCIAPLKNISSSASISLKRWLATRGLTMTGRKPIWSKDKFFSWFRLSRHCR